jgi:hypothetical protein
LAQRTAERHHQGGLGPISTEQARRLRTQLGHFAFLTYEARGRFLCRALQGARQRPELAEVPGATAGVVNAFAVGGREVLAEAGHRLSRTTDDDDQPDGAQRPSHQEKTDRPPYLGSDRHLFACPHLDQGFERTAAIADRQQQRAPLHTGGIEPAHQFAAAGQGPVDARIRKGKSRLGSAGKLRHQSPPRRSVGGGDHDIQRAEIIVDAGFGEGLGCSFRPIRRSSGVSEFLQRRARLDRPRSQTFIAQEHLLRLVRHPEIDHREQRRRGKNSETQEQGTMKRSGAKHDFYYARCSVSPQGPYSNERHGRDVLLN